MMEYYQAIAMWRAMTHIGEPGTPVEAKKSQPEEAFVPFHLPPAKPEPKAETRPPVAVPSREAVPAGV